MRAKFVMSEVGIGLRRNLTMTFAVMITVAISLSLLGIGLLANSQVRVMTRLRFLSFYVAHSLKVLHVARV